MKQLIIPFVASFGLSLGIATGVVIVRAPKAPAVQAVAKPAEASQKVDPVATPKDTGVVPAADSAGRAVVAQTGNMTANATPSPSATTPAVGHTAATVQPAAVSRQPIATAAANANTKAASSPSAAAKPVLPASKPVSDSLIGRRLAQVFGAMQAKDAARVLEQMDDTDVRAILGSLSSKQQAAILGSFPTQRAALILQATLRTASSGGAE